MNGRGLGPSGKMLWSLEKIRLQTRAKTKLKQIRMKSMILGVERSFGCQKDH
jgi:hypothetical protein